MKVGIVHFMAYPEAQRGEGPIPDTVAKIAEDPFFGAIEITTVPNPTERAQVARLLAGAHLVVGYGGQPIQLSGKLDVNALDSAKRQAAVDRLKLAIDEAYE